MKEEFHRIKQLPPYVFEGVNQLKAKYRINTRNTEDILVLSKYLNINSHKALKKLGWKSKLSIKKSNFKSAAFFLSSKCSYKSEIFRLKA